jgi:flagellar assembly protein FliH
MMISPSEDSGVNGMGRDIGTRIPVRLLGEAARGVSRLEFFPLERSETVVEIKVEKPEVFLKDEVATLDERVGSQAEQISVDMELVRSEARAEVLLEYEQELEKRIAEERTAVLKICEEFRRERTKYFAGVESEVVQLALAIAARVLHREVKLDPLLLTGVVRVALEKVAGDSATVLRVPAGEMEMWEEVFAGRSEPSVEIVGDERLSVGECVLDTNVGRVELGVNAQLKEIERGFFDLMQQRPA